MPALSRVLEPLDSLSVFLYFYDLGDSKNTGMGIQSIPDLKTG